MFPSKSYKITTSYIIFTTTLITNQQQKASVAIGLIIPFFGRKQSLLLLLIMLLPPLMPLLMVMLFKLIFNFVSTISSVSSVVLLPRSYRLTEPESVFCRLNLPLLPMFSVDTKALHFLLLPHTLLKMFIFLAKHYLSVMILIITASVIRI